AGAEVEVAAGVVGDAEQRSDQTVVDEVAAGDGVDPDGGDRGVRVPRGQREEEQEDEQGCPGPPFPDGLDGCLRGVHVPSFQNCPLTFDEPHQKSPTTLLRQGWNVVSRSWGTGRKSARIYKFYRQPGRGIGAAPAHSSRRATTGSI